MISSVMNLKTKLRLISLMFWVLFISIVSLFVNFSVRAADLNAKYIFKYDSSVVKGDSFTMHVYIYAPSGVRISQARLAFKFDPNYIEISKVRAYQDVFCRYPTDNNQYVLDNDTGDFLITGYSTGTQDCPFVEPNGQNVLFLDLIVVPKKTGTTIIDVIYNPSDNVIATDSSLLMDDKSPAQFILAKPDDPSIKIVDQSVSPTTTLTSTAGYVPSTGISPFMGIGLAIVFVVTGSILIKKNSFEKRVESSRYKHI